MKFMVVNRIGSGGEKILNPIGQKKTLDGRPLNRKSNQLGGRATLKTQEAGRGFAPLRGGRLGGADRRRLFQKSLQPSVRLLGATGFVGEIDKHTNKTPLTAKKIL